MLEPPYDYQFRFILIGDSTVGKSTILKVFSDGNFQTICDPTVGVDFFAKTIQLRNGVRIKLQLWDTAGQEKFKSITRSYYWNSVGVMFLYDVTRRETFDHLIDWLAEVNKHIDTSRCVFQIISTKCDKPNRTVPAEEGRAFAQFHDIKFVETSSKLGTNVELAFQMLAQQVYDQVESGQIELDEYWEGVKKNRYGRRSTAYSSAIKLNPKDQPKRNCC